MNIEELRIIIERDKKTHMTKTNMLLLNNNIKYMTTI